MFGMLFTSSLLHHLFDKATISVAEDASFPVCCFWQAEAELRHKMELIAEIRAMASVPIDRTKFVDLTSTVGHGLLCEMSVAEVGFPALLTAQNITTDGVTESSVLF